MAFDFVLKKLEQYSGIRNKGDENEKNRRFSFCTVNAVSTAKGEELRYYYIDNKELLWHSDL